MITHLCIRYECMQQVQFLIIVMLAIKVKQVINPESMCAGYKTVHRYICLQRAGSAHSHDGEMCK